MLSYQLLSLVQDSLDFLGIPKHSFLMWLFVLNRCPMRDRLINWGLPSAPNCLLSNAMAESRNHLFFECPYSWNVWTEIAAKCNLSPNQSWDQILLDLQALRCPRLQKLLSILACQCVIYLLWTERNNHLHRRIFCPPHSVTSSVSGTIRSKIAALRDQSPRLSSSMFSIWLA